MSNPVPAEASYKTLVVKFIDQVQNMEGMNLLRYQRIGQLFTEFLEGLTGGRYGRGASVQQLAADLQQNGVLTDIRDPQRMLYYAKNLYASYPDPQQLVAFAKQGFTVTHAKLLMMCKPEVYDQVLHKAVVSDRFVSARQLMALVAEAQGGDKPSEAMLAASESEEIDLVPPVTDGGPRQAATSTPDLMALQPELPGNPPLPTPESGAPSPAVAAAATTNTIGPERTVQPKKTLSTVNSLLEKLMVNLPDVFIVVKETAQIGTDSPTQHARYMETIMGIAHAAKDVRKILTELISEIDDEVGAGGARAAE